MSEARETYGEELTRESLDLIRDLLETIARAAYELGYDAGTHQEGVEPSWEFAKPLLLAHVAEHLRGTALTAGPPT